LDDFFEDVGGLFLGAEGVNGDVVVVVGVRDADGGEEL
jgi:hypothetical protein